MAAVSGYSVAHDPEVQQYRAMRAAWKAEMRAKAEAERTNSTHGQDRPTGKGAGLLRRMLGRGKMKGGKDGRAVGTETKAVGEGGGDGEEGEGWTSDAETEIDMVEALKGEDEVKDGRREAEGKEKMGRNVQRAPPYVFLSALPGVTVSRKGW